MLFKEMKNMPPKIQTTKEMILDAAFEIVRKEGSEHLSIRKISEYLGCSTQPVLYNFRSISEIREETYKKADKFHSEYLMTPDENFKINPLLSLGMNYVKFGYEESNLFKFLFQTDKFNGLSNDDLLSNPEASVLIEITAKNTECSIENAKDMFFTLFIAVHGYASLLANNSMKYDEEKIKKILHNIRGRDKND